MLNSYISLIKVLRKNYNASRFENSRWNLAHRPVIVDYHIGWISGVEWGVGTVVHHYVRHPQQGGWNPKKLQKKIQTKYSRNKEDYIRKREINQKENEWTLTNRKANLLRL